MVFFVVFGWFPWFLKVVSWFFMVFGWVEKGLLHCVRINSDLYGDIKQTLVYISLNTLECLRTSQHEPSSVKNIYC